jgi:hypothetical protein
MASASETSTVRISVTGTTITTFEVSRYLIMNLQYFQKLLSGDLSDSTVDVDTEAMHVFLLILHHKYKWLPSNRSIDQMAALADLCVEIDSDDTQDDLASSSNDLTLTASCPPRSMLLIGFPNSGITEGPSTQTGSAGTIYLRN